MHKPCCGAAEALARVQALCDNHEAGIAAWKAANRSGFPLGEPGIPAGEVRAAITGEAADG